LLKSFTGSLLLWQMPAGQKRLYLTFDDGPEPGITEEILEELEAFGAKATFFLLGQNAQKQPQLMRDLLNRGHGLGNHGWLHLDGWKTGTQAYIKNVEKHPVNLPGSLFRPPYGRLTPWQAAAIRKMNLQIVMWSISSMDYSRKINVEQALHNLIDLTDDGGIVLMHDSQKAAPNCLYLLPRFLDHFLRQGYSFEILPGALLRPTGGAQL